MAFEEARAANRPVRLLIGAARCGGGGRGALGTGGGDCDRGGKVVAGADDDDDDDDVFAGADLDISEGTKT